MQRIGLPDFTHVLSGPGNVPLIFAGETTEFTDSLSSACELSAQAAPVKDAQIRGFCKQKLTFYDTTHYPSWQDISWTSPLETVGKSSGP